ncbi:MAG: hypothetical protein CMH47_09410 [Muricauda sp.]|nr:hypothetical protein [Allomuricauda sp.]|tara:strand:- start:2319 stop:2987 length:669 start_codon:yes stop_codon:yes gene_type:complete
MMKKKYIYYIAILFLAAFVLNSIGLFGLGFWGMSKQNEREAERRRNQIPQEEWVAEQRYTDYYEPKIDSFLQANPSQAISYIDKVLKKYPEKDFLYIYKGMGFYKIDSFELAHKEFKKAMAKAGYESPAALGYSGWALAKMERYDEAISEFKKAVKTNSNYEYDLALVYEMKGDFQNAINYYEKEIDETQKLNPLQSRIDSNTVKYLAELRVKLGALKEKVK